VRRRSRLSLARAAALAATLCVATTSFSQTLPAGVDECLARIDQQRRAEPPIGGLGAAGDEPAGPTLLGDACPELAAAIDEGAWGKALVDIRAEDLSTNAFEELARLVARYEQPPAPALQPLAIEALDPVLAALELREPDQELSVWDRIQRWYDENFGARETSAGRWIEDWLNNLSLPERFVRYLLIGLGTALVVATIAIVANELRIAGVLAGGALRKYSPLAGRESENDARVRDFDDVARAPLKRRPALLLLLVLDRLRARAAVPLRDSLTHRELVSAAGDLSVEQSDALRAVAGAAERVTFGDWQPAERDVDEVVARGRALVASLAELVVDPRVAAERGEPR